MEGLYILGDNAPAISTDCGARRVQLLLKRSDLEIMQQNLSPSSTIWLCPAEDPTMVEYFVILSGSLTVVPTPEEACTLGPGDCFFAESIKTDIRLIANADTQVLYITNRPVYDMLTNFRDDYERLLARIDEKDHVTVRHSKNVLDYSLALFNAIQPSGVTMDDMALAALFHDVGKCHIPDEILKKTDKLTPEEYRTMQQHAENTYNILLPGYGAGIAGIALQHHERLDGSGYPNGLSGEEICMCARIMAVADSFDAMISARPYNRIKTPEAAITELYSLPCKYDISVVKVLDRLYRSGQLVLHTA